MTDPTNDLNALDAALAAASTDIKNAQTAAAAVRADVGTPTPPPVTGKVPLYVYTGNGNLAGAKAFAVATGKTLAGVSDYCSGASWSSIETPPGISNYQGSGFNLALGVNPAPDASWSGHGGNTTSTWQSVVAGTYDTHYTNLCDYLISLGFTAPLLRIAWEMSGGQPWSPTAQSDNPLIAAGIARIAHVCKLALPNCKVDCNPLWGGQYVGGVLMNSAAAVPATSADIDFISCDMYDQSWNATIFPPSGQPNNTATSAQATSTWNDAMTTNSYSVTSWLSLGKANGKKFSMPECGTNIRKDGHGLGDDPVFWQKMDALLAANPTGYISVYNFNDGQNNCVLTGGSFPNALAAFKAAKSW